MEFNYNRGRTFEKTCYTTVEVTQFVDAITGTGACLIRNKALMWTLYGTGARIDEALSLEVKDIELTQGRIHIRSGKATSHGKNRGVKQERYAYIVFGVAQEAIRKWLDARRNYINKSGKELSKSPDGKEYMFCTLKGKKMTANYFNREMPAWATKAGLGRMHPHGMRRSHAITLLHEHNASLTSIQDQLGHKNIGTTQIYLDNIKRAQRRQTEMQRISSRT